MKTALKTMLAFAALALAAQSPPIPASESRLLFDALDAGRYLEAIDRARGTVGADRPDPAGPNYGTWRQIHPFIGGTLDPALYEPGPYRGSLNETLAERYRVADARDAVREIAARARATRIVILNEAHDSPRDRAFGLEVARALRPLGYRVLAIEALSNYADPAARDAAMAALAHDGFPRLRIGHYLRDPIFGDFLRQSLALGYRPFAYEQTERDDSGTPLERVSRREQAQAEHLAEFIRRNPNERLFIYVGYGHVAEAPVPHPEGMGEWMAMRLERLTGIDPLTVDQTVFDETSARMRAYRDLVAPRMHGRPAIPFDAGAPLSAPGGAVDLQVLHPPLRFVQGRPAWMLRMGRRPVAIPRRCSPPPAAVSSRPSSPRSPPTQSRLTR